MAFTRTVMTEVDPAMECQLGSAAAPASRSMTAASMRYVPAGSTTATTIPGAPGAARIAARWPALAIVPLRIPQPMGNTSHLPPGARTGSSPGTCARSTRRCTAGFTGVPSGSRHEREPDRCGRPDLLGRQPRQALAPQLLPPRVRTLDGHVQPELALGRSTPAAWVSGRSVMTLNLANGHVSRVYRGMLVPHGLALANGRLVWWVTGRSGGSRVLRLPLP